MSNEENKAIVVRHFKDVMEQGHVDLIASYFGSDATNPDSPAIQGLKNMVLWHHKHCPGIKVSLLDIMAEGDKVMANIEWDLTYSVPSDPPEDQSYPFGKPIKFRNMNIFTIVNGRIVSQSPVLGLTNMLIETGLIPSPYQAAANKAVARRFLEEAWNQCRVNVVDEIYSPDGSDPDMDKPEVVKGNITFFHTYAPGIKFTILNLIAEADTVMTHWQVDVTYSILADPPKDEFCLPFGKPVKWMGVDIYRIVDGKIVAIQHTIPWSDTLVKIGVTPLEKIVQNKAAVRKFVDAINRRDTALLAEVSTLEVAKAWTEALPGMYASMKNHHIELDEIIADGEGAAVRMSTSGYHSGDLHGLAPTGKWWTNRVFTFFQFVDGKISGIDPLPDAENLIKQLGGVIKPAA